jgi:hypothetical protein
MRDEVERIKRRIAKADRRLARGVDERQEARGVVRESEIRDRLLKKLEELEQKGSE